MNGIINVLKPPGMTSHDVVNHLRKLFNIKKIGHMGTLDPGVPGVLPVGVGKGTRMSEFMLNAPKSYRAEATFGIRTSTEDAQGRVLTKNSAGSLTKEELVTVMRAFEGELLQTPPTISAVRKNGKRLYQWTREGKIVDREQRKVNIYALNLIRWYEHQEHPRALFDIKCSKGTYIRTLVADIGDHLKLGAYLSFLLRTEAGCFHLEDSNTLEEIEDHWRKGQDDFLKPLDTVVSHLPRILVTEKGAQKISCGSHLEPCEVRTKNVNLQKCVGLQVRIYDQNSNFLAIGIVGKGGKDNWCVHGKKVFVNKI